MIYRQPIIKSPLQYVVKQPKIDFHNTLAI